MLNPRDHCLLEAASHVFNNLADRTFIKYARYDLSSICEKFIIFR
jgi:hypothetical protein